MGMLGSVHAGRNVSAWGETYRRVGVSATLRKTHCMSIVFF
jgi:hypothetical protein